jgi:hypothetical protein
MGVWYNPSAEIDTRTFHAGLISHQNAHSSGDTTFKNRAHWDYRHIILYAYMQSSQLLESGGRRMASLRPAWGKMKEDLVSKTKHKRSELKAGSCSLTLVTKPPDSCEGGSK